MSARPDDCGHYDWLQKRRALFAAAKAKCTAPPVRHAWQKNSPLFAQGRYVQPSLKHLIKLVADVAHVHWSAITGHGRRRELVDCRSVVANLAHEFHPQLSDRAIDDAMLRGQGMTAWYIERHADRLKLFPSYFELFSACRAEMERTK